MRKIIVFNMVTLDGLVAGLNGEIEWHRVDDEFNQFAIQQLHSAGALIFGRITYQLMASYWPTPAALKDDPVVADLMNTLPKIVVSRTLESAGWDNTRLVRNNLAEELQALKQRPGGDLFVFGSANLCATLIEQGLIDEYRLIINPIVLGAGIPFFKDLPRPLLLQYGDQKVFQNGNVLLMYRPERTEGLTK